MIYDCKLWMYIMIVCAFYGIITESWRYSTSILYNLPHSSPLCGRHETCAQSPTPIVQPCGCRLLHHQGPAELFFCESLKSLIFFVRLKIIEISGVYGCLQILIKNDSKSFWDPVNRGWTRLDRSTNIFNAWHIEELKLMTNVDFRGIWIIYKPYAKICKISQLCMLDDQSQYCTSETIHNHESISGENGPKSYGIGWCRNGISTITSAFFFHDAPSDELALAFAILRCFFGKNVQTSKVIDRKFPESAAHCGLWGDIGPPKQAVEKSWRLGVTNSHPAEASCLA